MDLVSNTLLDLESTSKIRIFRQIRRSIIMGHRRPGERLEVEEFSAPLRYQRHPGSRCAADAQP